MTISREDVAKLSKSHPAVAGAAVQEIQADDEKALQNRIKRHPRVQKALTEFQKDVEASRNIRQALLDARHDASGEKTGNEPEICQSNEKDHYRKVSSAEPQCPVRDDSLEPTARKEENAGIVSVRLVSFRRRLIDPDNLCAKYFIDACRYLGFLHGDAAKDIEFSIRQEKVETDQEERTEIEIEYP